MNNKVDLIFSLLFRKSLAIPCAAPDNYLEHQDLWALIKLYLYFIMRAFVFPGHIQLNKYIRGYGYNSKCSLKRANIWYV
jgi:hypothetical protein